jgi:hypothetical protein
MWFSFGHSLSDWFDVVILLLVLLATALGTYAGTHGSEATDGGTGNKSFLVVTSEFADGTGVFSHIHVFHFFHCALFL